MSDYSKYAKVEGFKCKRGKKAEFDVLAEQLFHANGRLRYLGLYDPNNEYNTVLAEREEIRRKLAEVSVSVETSWIKKKVYLQDIQEEG